MLTSPKKQLRAGHDARAARGGKEWPAGRSRHALGGWGGRASHCEGQKESSSATPSVRDSRSVQLAASTRVSPSAGASANGSERRSKQMRLPRECPRRTMGPTSAGQSCSGQGAAAECAVEALRCHGAVADFERSLILRHAACATYGLDAAATKHDSRSDPSDTSGHVPARKPP